VDAPHGLFPQVLSQRASPRERSRILRLWTLIGRFVGRALREGRTVDMNLSPLFVDLLQGRDLCADASANMAILDPQFEWSLRRLEALGSSPNAQAYESVEAMCLDFVLPGHNGVELVPGGSSLAVTPDNVITYADFVRGCILSRGIEAQIHALCEGLSEVFPLHYLSIFSRPELRELLCGSLEDDEKVWQDEEDFERDLVCDHGYSSDSTPVRALISVVASFTAAQQRQFLAFVSGSPRVPLGGLHPKITVVKRDLPFSSPGLYGDVDEVPLPTVNTCFHYFKLPPYASIQMLQEKLEVAMSDGTGSFDLS